MTAIYGARTTKRSTKAELAELDDTIVEAVAAENPLTVRRTFYLVESAGAVEKSENGARKVQRRLLELRLLELRRDGRVPYDWITDGTRYVIRPTTHRDVETMLSDAAASYRRALWHDQPVEVHVFTEKDAISGVISPVTDEWDVPLGVLRGYASESFAWQMAQAVKGCGKRTVCVYQLGDHDPSGVGAWRDFQRKVVGFLGDKITTAGAEALRRHGITTRPGDPLGVEETEPDEPFGDPEQQTTYSFLGGPGFHGATQRKVTFERLAVTEDQIADWQLPTRPTKRRDPRAKGFRGESVEVDAVSANTLRQLVRDAIVAHIDSHAYEVTRQVEQSERELLTNIAEAGGRDA